MVSLTKIIASGKCDYVPPASADPAADPAAADAALRNRGSHGHLRLKHQDASDSDDSAENQPADADKAPKQPAPATASVDFEKLPILQRINWLHTYILAVPPLLGLVGLFFFPIYWKTVALSVVWYLFCGLGITAGYHRLWSHKSYDAALPVELFLACFGAAALEGSARWWCRNHRAHHRYVDSPKDPYSVHKGFWYAHIGWMIMKQDVTKIGRVDIADLNKNKVLQWQHKYYLEIALTFGYVLPFLIAWLGWNDPVGGILVAGFLRTAFIHHSTFFINSAAHTFGSPTFSLDQSAKDNIWTAFVTLGEGYHSFHHEFPHDFRNGVLFHHYDPTKWFIRALSFLGLTWNLKTFPKSDWERSKIRVQQEQLRRQIVELQSSLEHSPDFVPLPDAALLPEWTSENVARRVEQGRTMIIVRGLVVDATDFASEHPGGKGMLNFWNGRDATMAVEGEVYKHTRSAQDVMLRMAVARFRNVEDLDNTKRSDKPVEAVRQAARAMMQDSTGL